MQILIAPAGASNHYFILYHLQLGGQVLQTCLLESLNYNIIRIAFSRQEIWFVFLPVFIIHENKFIIKGSMHVLNKFNQGSIHTQRYISTLHITNYSTTSAFFGGHVPSATRFFRCSSMIWLRSFALTLVIHSEKSPVCNVHNLLRLW